MDDDDDDTSNSLCCCLNMSSSFNSFKKLTTQAFTYLLDTPQQHPSLVAYTRYSLPLKFKYERPVFLELDEEATAASADHEIRPIMHPKRPLVLNAGYAEVINAGKTLQTNEDQSVFDTFVVTVPLSRRDETWTENMCEIPCVYFGVFDGHAGFGASLAAYHGLRYHLEEKLAEIAHMIVLSKEEMASKHMSTGLITTINAEQLITGALEKAFFQMDDEIRQQRFDFRIEGGCTALVSLFIKGKLYTACAGDSRAVLYEKDSIVPMSMDHTPETDRKRVQTLAYHIPSLLADEYTLLQFQHRCRKKDVGTKQLFRDHTMDGWGLKHIDKYDLRPQLISGEGKRSRLLDTIGTTRGFGDHDLEVPYGGNLKIKPFLTPQPDVRVYDLETRDLDDDDVLVMATDGLWEKIENIEAARILQHTFGTQSPSETRRYILAAQNLVDQARGVLGDRGWRTLANTPGSYDDISVFVIPLKGWKKCLNNVLLAHRRKREPSAVVNEEEYLNIPHNIVGQLSEEREKKELQDIKRCYDEISGVDIKHLNTTNPVAKNDGTTNFIAKDDGTTSPVAKDDGTTSPVSKDDGTTNFIARDDGTTSPVAKDDGTTSPVSKDDGTTNFIARDDGTTSPVAKEDGTTSPVSKDDGTTNFIANDDGATNPVAKDDGVSNYITKVNGEIFDAHMKQFNINTCRVDVEDTMVVEQTSSQRSKKTSKNPGAEVQQNDVLNNNDVNEEDGISEDETQCADTSRLPLLDSSSSSIN